MNNIFSNNGAMLDSQPQLSHPKYRPDIDGLRAVAVLAVISFHAFPNWMKGGFIGVDVFFVISGFLISTIIFENLERGTFNFAEFYARRIKRIFPALLLVLVATYVFGWFILLTDEYKQLGKHIAAGAGFASNFMLWSEAGYFDNSAETKPLNHLWSLGIEEQFYIVWPLLLWLAWKRNFNLLTIMIFVATFSFYLNVKGVNKDAIATFYSPQTRFWELLCGSLLAWFSLYEKDSLTKIKTKLGGWLASAMYREKTETNEISLTNALSFVGLLLLVYGFWRINSGLSFPGMWAVVPVLGTALMILAGPYAWINHSILSNKFAVWFGLISYPLYLWHWPLLSFARIIDGEVPSRNIRIAVLVASVILAWLTYKLVERPLRLGKQNKSKVIVLIVLMTITGLVGYNTSSRDGLEFREVIKLNPPKDKDDDGHGSAAKSIFTGGCGLDQTLAAQNTYVCGRDSRGTPRFALIGDSKALAMYSGIFKTSKDGGRWLVIAGPGPNGYVFPVISSDPLYSRTQISSLAIINTLNKAKNIEVVAIAAATRSFFSLKNSVDIDDLEGSPNFGIAFEGLKKFVSKLVTAGKRVVLLVDNPTLPYPEDCMGRMLSISFLNTFANDNYDHCRLPLNAHLQKSKLYRQLLTEVASAHPDSVTIFDTLPYLCSVTQNLCEIKKNGVLLYSYGDHLSDRAAQLIGYDLNEFLKVSSRHLPEK